MLQPETRVSLYWELLLVELVTLGASTVFFGYYYYYINWLYCEQLLVVLGAATGYTGSCYWLYWELLLDILGAAAGYTRSCCWLYWELLLVILGAAAG